MEISLFLAKLLGLYLLIAAGLWALRGDAITKLIIAFFRNRELVFLSGLLAVAMGLAIAIGHPVWELSWRGLITVFGYLAIAAGIARVGFPEVPQKAAESLLKGNAIWIWIFLSFLLGAYLTWAGFTQ